jgi:uncharacterized protein (TIGR02246 family)
MHRRDALVLGATGALAMTIGEAVARTPDDLTGKVRHVVNLYAAAWNASDMDAMAALYTGDVHWVNIVGMHWRGKTAVDRAHRVFFEIMFKGVPLRLEEIESVTPLPGGAVVAVVRWSVGAFRTPVGEQVPPSRDRMTLVLVPDGDRLRIAHGANVQIDEMAQRSDPISPARE